MSIPTLDRKDIQKLTNTNSIDGGNWLQRNLPYFSKKVGRAFNPVHNVKAIHEGLEKIGGISTTSAKSSVTDAYNTARGAVAKEFGQAYEKLKSSIETPLSTAGSSAKEFLEGSLQDQREILKELSKDQRSEIGKAVEEYQKSIRFTAVTIKSLAKVATDINELPTDAKSRPTDPKSKLVKKLELCSNRKAIDTLENDAKVAKAAQETVVKSNNLAKEIEETADLIDPGRPLKGLSADSKIVELDDTTAKSLQSFMKKRMEKPQRALETAEAEFVKNPSKDNLAALEKATKEAQEAFDKVKDVFKVVAEGLQDFGKIQEKKMSSGKPIYTYMESRFDKAWMKLKGLDSTADLDPYVDAKNRLKARYFEAVTHAVSVLGDTMTSIQLSTALEPFEKRRTQLFQAEEVDTPDEINNIEEYKNYLNTPKGPRDFNKELEEKLTAAKTIGGEKTEEEKLFDFT